MEKQHPIGDLMTSTMQKIREIADVNTIIGQPIEADGVSIIPISRLTVGSGAGMSLAPVAFLIVKDGTVRLLPVAPHPGSAVDRVVDMVPDVLDKVTGIIEKQTEKDKDTL